MDFLEKFEKLPEEVQNVFGSNEPRLALERACFLYNIFEDDVKKLTQIIADIFLKELQLEQLPMKIRVNFNVNDNAAYGIAYEISIKIFVPLSEYFTDVQVLMEKWQSMKIAPLVSEEKAWKRVLEIEPWILEEEKEREKQVAENLAKVEQINIEAAIDKYQRIGEHAISANPIALQNFPTPARPSIKNWIVDFHDRIGVGKHSPIDRGNYLFHSVNGKVLSAAERQRVGAILKSLDEQTPLTIDPEREIVVFEGEHVQDEKQVSHGALDSRLRGNDKDDVLDSHTDVNKSVNFVNQNAGNINQPPRDILDLRFAENRNVQRKNVSVVDANRQPHNALDSLPTGQAGRLRGNDNVVSQGSFQSNHNAGSQDSYTHGNDAVRITRPANDIAARQQETPSNFVSQSVPVSLHTPQVGNPQVNNMNANSYIPKTPVTQSEPIKNIPQNNDRPAFMMRPAQPVVPARPIHVDEPEKVEIATVKKDEAIEKFYSPAPKPAEASFVEKIPVQKPAEKTQPIVEQKPTPEIEQAPQAKPMVALKNISFSPNFVAAPRSNNPKVENVKRHDEPLGPHIPVPPLKRDEQTKTEIFSVPGSKPPIGTDHYDAKKSVHFNPEPAKELVSASIASGNALDSLPTGQAGRLRGNDLVGANVKQPLSSALDSRLHGNDMVVGATASQPSSSVLDSHLRGNDKEKISDSVPSARLVRQLENNTVAPKIAVEKVEQKIEMPLDINSQQDLDSMSDEMLLKLYQQKKIQNKVATSQQAKPKGFHIGPMHLESEVNQKNVVNLKN